ncbi:uncharacterized protein LOC111626456 [Centruroides sculpturatus]|uniref:uncharacterized protein LOC111626456 n=1 Tax=Centruroides sculpturatus TaxID=218467 RepID=UPI000C6E8C68|nr:uncharacterized protein LOC111626456 [Centruroides sculpturatus]
MTCTVGSSDYIPLRYFITFMLFMGLCITYCARGGLSIAIVAMVNITKNSTRHPQDRCPISENGSTYSFENQGEFYWDPYLRSIILVSFFYGFILTQIPGGWLSEKLGGKWFFGGGVFLSCLLNLTFPVAARAGHNIFIVVRVLSGFFEGVTYPAMFSMMVHWSTLKERSLLLAIACMGGNVGAIIATPLGAFLCEKGFAGGWPSVFYVSGVWGCLWFLVWVFSVFNKPAEHPWISERERLYLQINADTAEKKLPIPWKGMFTSIPFWALFYARFAIAWGLFIILTELPSYLESVFSVTLKENGDISSIVNIVLCVGMIFAGYVSDYLREKKRFSITAIRKGFEFSGLIGCGTCLIIIPQIGCNIPLITTVMSIGLFFFGFNTGGSTPTIADMAPDFSGIMCGILATLPTSGAFLGPMVAGLITHDGETIDQWNLVFYITAGIIMSGGTCFLILGSAEVQPWAKVPSIMDNNSISSIESNKVVNPKSLDCVASFQNDSVKFYYIPARYFLTFMFFSGLCIVLCFRVGLSIALVAMTNNTKTPISSDRCDNPEANSTYEFQNQKEFDWDPYIQGIILASFFYGYIFTQLPGGWLAEKIGGKWLFGGGVFCSSLLNLLFPVAARAGYDVLIVVRILSGFGEGATYPAMFIMMVYWSTLKERSFLLGIACMGANVGSIIATPIAAHLCENGFAGGWPSVFYVLGICGCLWFVLWAFTVFNKPTEHPGINNLEKIYLEQDPNSTKKQLPVPWKSIFTSIPFWALLYTRFANFWGLFTVTAELPSYLESVYNMTLKQNGIASAIIYTFLCLGMIVSGYVSDYLRQKRHFSVTVIRKSFEFAGLVGCGVCLIALPRIGCNIPLIISILSAGLFLFGFNTGGSTPTIVDMAPDFAGTMCGLLATLPTVGAFLGPMVTGYLTQEGQTIDQWNSVLYITAGILISGGICFLIWGSAEVQPWAKYPFIIQSSPSLTEEEISKERNSDSLNCVASLRGQIQ